MSPRVVLVGKPGCHLCDVAREVIEIVCAEAEVEFAELDIWEDASLADQYAERVPVVLVDGQEVSQFRVDTARLRKALDAS